MARKSRMKKSDGRRSRRAQRMVEQAALGGPKVFGSPPRDPSRRLPGGPVTPVGGPTPTVPKRRRRG